MSVTNELTKRQVEVTNESLLSELPRFVIKNTFLKGNQAASQPASQTSEAVSTTDKGVDILPPATSMSIYDIHT